jgi:thiol-disulfide isomerase/thioredoxin
MSTESAETPDRPTVVATREELDEVLSDNERVLVMVRTTGCTICKSMEPILDNVARATDAAVAVFNPKADLDAVEAFNVRSVPTYLLFADGEQIDRRDDGFVPTAELVEFVEGDG